MPNDGLERNPSLSDRFKNFFPSRRPEKGGTHRNRGYQEGPVTKESRNSAPLSPSTPNLAVPPDKPQRHTEGTQPPIDTPISEPHTKTGKKSNARVSGWRESSDQITRWNTAKDILPVSSSTPASTAEQKERRRQRRMLRESGDYLGVQGVNPKTGVLDVLTPTATNDSSSDSTLSIDARQKLLALEKRNQTARQAYQQILASTQQEARDYLIEREREKLAQQTREKEEIRSAQRQVRWRRGQGQWSSAQEPELSPITQSLASLSRQDSNLARVKEPIPSGRPSGSLPANKQNEDEDMDAAQAEDEPSGNSSDTVVRTPVRRTSSLNPSLTTPAKVGAKNIKLPPTERAQAEASRVGEITENETHKPPHSSPKRQQSSKPVSFLGVRSRENDPGGTMTTEMSAFTPITTTTGYGRMPATFLLAPTSSTSPKYRSPKPAAIATTDATSVRLLDATRWRLQKLSRTASGRRDRIYLQRHKQLGARALKGLPRCGAPKAARGTTTPGKATRRREPATRETGHLLSPKAKAVQGKGASGDSADIGGPTRASIGKSVEVGEWRDGSVKFFVEVVEVLEWLSMLASRLVQCYWHMILRPCLDPQSRLRRRYATRETTVLDLFVVVLAYLTLLFGLLLSVKLWRGIIWGWLVVERQLH